MNPSMTTSRVHVPYLATLTAPLHHGAGTAGNTILLRTGPVILPDGRVAKVPFVSGNSMRHLLRAALAWHAARTLEIPDGSLIKPVVDLLWSGGAITRTGAETRLDILRRVERLHPPLTLMGYSAAADMTAGTLFVNYLNLVCGENQWRLPPTARDLPHAHKPAAVFRGEEFGTRHDVSGSPVDRYIQAVDDLLGATSTPTTQMIYDMQVLIPGSVLAGSFDLAASATVEHRRVLAVALDEVMPLIFGRRTVKVGAKTAIGYGVANVDIDLSPLCDVGEAREWWEQHLRDHREEILAVWREVVA